MTQIEKEALLKEVKDTLTSAYEQAKSAFELTMKQAISKAELIIDEKVQVAKPVNDDALVTAIVQDLVKHGAISKDYFNEPETAEPEVKAEPVAVPTPAYAEYAEVKPASVGFVEDEPADIESPIGTL